MSVDHNRPLPVAPERLDALAVLYGPAGTLEFLDLNGQMRREILAIALLGEQVEYLQNINQGIWDAHDIYNGRFR